MTPCYIAASPKKDGLFHVFLDENLGCCFQLGQIYLIIKWLYRSLIFRCETEDVLVQHISGAADDLERISTWAF